MPNSAGLPPILPGFADFARGFDVALCDIWGVVHGGVHAFAPACDALTRFREKGGTVILVSNAPRPGAAVVPQLDGLGVPRSAWDGLVTSGDVARAFIEKERGRPYFWLGPERDGPLFEGLGAAPVPFDQAEWIVCTGLIDDETETPDSYADLLAQARRRDMEFLCANPDLVVERGGKLIYCAGAIGQAYERLGGPTVYAGKPDRPIYDAALGVAASIRRARTDLSRVLAIGDALRTDIAGATKLGCASLFVARGIHSDELGIADRPLDGVALGELLAKAGPSPTAAIDRLVW
jgi:HAD superfamily hydrolase (TIGR01459 family)